MFLKSKIGLTLIDLNWIFPMKPSEFEISISVKIYNKKKTTKNFRNNYDVEKRIVTKLAQIVKLNHDSVKIPRPYL